MTCRSAPQTASHPQKTHAAEYLSAGRIPPHTESLFQPLPAAGDSHVQQRAEYHTVLSAHSADEEVRLSQARRILQPEPVHSAPAYEIFQQSAIPVSSFSPALR